MEEALDSSPGQEEAEQEQIELTEDETNFLVAVSTFSTAGDDLLHALQKLLGPDPKNWSTENVVFRKMKRELMHGWIESKWKNKGTHGREKACAVLGTTLSEVVPAFQKEMRIPTKFADRGSPLQRLKEGANRTFWKHIQNKVINPAKILQQVSVLCLHHRFLLFATLCSRHFRATYQAALAEQEEGEDRGDRAPITVCDPLEAGGFYAMARLRLITEKVWNSIETAPGRNCWFVHVHTLVKVWPKF
jgi:hypothetical protein